MRLFKIVFASVTLFPDNEPVLQPHLAKIVTNSLKYAPLLRVILGSGLFLGLGFRDFRVLYL